jgi:K(+)-stimulated pyrophosphate-energized sodium pump
MNLLLIAIACGVVALLYGILTSQQVLRASAGNQRMMEVAGAIQEGASAYLRRQYTTIAIVGVVVTAIVAIFLGPISAAGCRARPASSA